MEEPRATLCVWLPLAMATVIRALGARHPGGRELKTSEILRLFCLPNMAAAMERDEQMGEQQNQVAWFDQLAARFGKVTVEKEQ